MAGAPTVYEIAIPIAPDNLYFSFWTSVFFLLACLITYLLHSEAVHCKTLAIMTGALLRYGTADGVETAELPEMIALW